MKKYVKNKPISSPFKIWLHIDSNCMVFICSKVITSPAKKDQPLVVFFFIYFIFTPIFEKKKKKMVRYGLHILYNYRP